MVQKIPALLDPNTKKLLIHDPLFKAVEEEWARFLRLHGDSVEELEEHFEAKVGRMGQPNFPLLEVLTNPAFHNLYGNQHSECALEHYEIALGQDSRNWIASFNAVSSMMNENTWENVKHNQTKVLGAIDRSIEVTTGYIAALNADDALRQAIIHNSSDADKGWFAKMDPSKVGLKIPAAHSNRIFTSTASPAQTAKEKTAKDTMSKHAATALAGMDRMLALKKQVENVPDGKVEAMMVEFKPLDNENSKTDQDASQEGYKGHPEGVNRPPPPPKKKKGSWWPILVGVVLCCVGGFIAAGALMGSAAFMGASTVVAMGIQSIFQGINSMISGDPVSLGQWFQGQSGLVVSAIGSFVNCLSAATRASRLFSFSANVAKDLAKAQVGQAVNGLVGGGGAAAGNGSGTGGARGSPSNPGAPTTDSTTSNNLSNPQPQTVPQGKAVRSIPIDLEEIKKAERKLDVFKSRPPNKIFNEQSVNGESNPVQKRWEGFVVNSHNRLSRDFVSRENIAAALVPCCAIINDILNKEKAAGVQRLRRAIAVGLSGNLVDKMRKTVTRQLGNAEKNLSWRGAFPAVRIDETVFDPEQQACIRPIASLRDTNLEAILTSSARDCLTDKCCEHLIKDTNSVNYICVWNIYTLHFVRRRDKLRITETQISEADFKRSFYALLQAKLLEGDLITLKKTVTRADSSVAPAGVDQDTYSFFLQVEKGACKELRDLEDEAVTLIENICMQTLTDILMDKQIEEVTKQFHTV
eukprot:gene33209-40977_t